MAREVVDGQTGNSLFSTVDFGHHDIRLLVLKLVGRVFQLWQQQFAVSTPRRVKREQHEILVLIHFPVCVRDLDDAIARCDRATAEFEQQQGQK